MTFIWGIQISAERSGQDPVRAPARRMPANSAEFRLDKGGPGKIRGGLRRGEFRRIPAFLGVDSSVSFLGIDSSASSKGIDSNVSFLGIHSSVSFLGIDNITIDSNASSKGD